MTELEHRLSELVAVLLRGRLSEVAEDPKPHSRLSLDFNANPPTVRTMHFETQEEADAYVEERSLSTVAEAARMATEALSKRAHVRPFGSQDYFPSTIPHRGAAALTDAERAALERIARPDSAFADLRKWATATLAAEGTAPNPICTETYTNTLPRPDQFNASADMPEGAPVSSANTRRLRSVSAGQLRWLRRGDRVVYQLSGSALNGVPFSIVCGAECGSVPVVAIRDDMADGSLTIVVSNPDEWQVVITPENEERFR